MRSTVSRRVAGRDELLLAVRERLVDETRGVFRDAVAREREFVPCARLMVRGAVLNTYERRRLWSRLVAAGRLPEVDAYRPQGAFVEWLRAGQDAGAFRRDVPAGWFVTAWMPLVVAGCTTVGRDGVDLETAAGLAADAVVPILTGVGLGPRPR